MRILVTGSRDWDDPQEVNDTLFMLGFGFRDEEITLVAGSCRSGADRYAEEYAEDRGWKIERHPADWLGWGKQAGFVRNQQMVDLGADVCVAFRKNHSPGTTHCGEAAEKAGIHTIWVEDEDTDG